MSALASTFGLSSADHPLRKAFLRWQCRVRQMAMREDLGRPGDEIMPHVTLPGETEPLGQVITLLNKVPGHEAVSEMEHMAAKTNDPAQIRDQAIKFLSATYYQKAAEFTDLLTATFPPGSPGAETLRAAERVTLTFEAFAQRFDITAKVWRLAEHNPLYRATMAHNKLFNPAIPPGTEVLAFEPDWTSSSAEPPLT